MSSESANLSRVESYQFPASHLGHLSQAQQEQLAKFKALCQKHGYFRPAAADGSEPASHDDETLLRYLRARRSKPRDAFLQFKATETWRKENKIDQLYDTIDVHVYEETRRLYPQWTGRRDLRGIPVYVFEVGNLNPKAILAHENSAAKPAEMKNSKVPWKMLRLFALYENLIQFTLPLCSAIRDRPNPETPISQSNNIVDISGVGWKQFWGLKNHMQSASELATANYPETLDRIFVIGAPSFFPTVWGWVKRWFDPITVSKIFILSESNMTSTLERYIEPANIPKKYGGQLDYSFGMMPVLEPAIQDSLTWQKPHPQSGLDTFPPGPIRWEKASDNTMIAVAKGSENKQPRNEPVATLHTRPAAPTEAKDASAALPAARPPLYTTTSGYYTHPPSPKGSPLELSDEPSSTDEAAASRAASGPVTPEIAAASNDAGPRFAKLDAAAAHPLATSTMSHSPDQEVRGAREPEGTKETWNGILDGAREVGPPAEAARLAQLVEKKLSVADGAADKANAVSAVTQEKERVVGEAPQVAAAEVGQH